MLNLNLGCGAETIDRPGWVNVDLEPRKPNVVRGDVLSLDNGDATVDGIATSHLLEHLPDTSAALAEWRRVLKPGGELLVAVPDASREKEWIGYHLAEARERGGALHEHHADLTQTSLEAALRSAGFAEVRKVDPMLRWELPGKAGWQACARGVKPCA